MLTNLVCREAEIQTLEEAYASKQPEFLSVCGRRRIGKTFLIKEFFSGKKSIFLKTTGSEDAPMSEQIANFTEALGEAFYGGARLQAEKNWRGAFQQLTHAISQVTENKPIILFLDEFPWMATKNSRLLQNLSYYWNQYWSNDKRIKLIICGSASNWIIQKIIQNKKGLHNRVTREIYLEPFNLRDTQRFLKSRGISLNQQHILNIYMATGGVAHYLNKIEKGLSSSQVIEHLAFRKKSFLMNEFEKLYASLFKEHEIYIDIVRAIAARHYGIGQEELFKSLSALSKGESGLRKLKDLEANGFIMSFTPLFKEKGIYYRVVDEYTLFYFHWIESIKNSLAIKGMRKGYWDKMMKTPAWYSWAGYAFETVCYRHLPQIGAALQLSPTALPSVWRHQPEKGLNEEGAQIDLLFDRDDEVMTIFEIKCTQEPFVIDKAYAKKLLKKVEIFQKITKTTKQIFVVFISANGLKKNIYSDDLISNTVSLSDLFKAEE